MGRDRANQQRRQMSCPYLCGAADTGVTNNANGEASSQTSETDGETSAQVNEAAAGARSTAAAAHGVAGGGQHGRSANQGQGRYPEYARWAYL